MAREGLTHQGSLSPQQQKTRLIRAMDDLQQCLTILDTNTSQQQSSQKQQRERQKMKQACQQALDRMETSYNKLDDTSTTTTSTSTPSATSATTQSTSTTNTTPTNNTKKNPATTNGTNTPSTPTTPVSTSLSQQKKDVMRLLLARQMAGATIPKGEAFFLLDWNWWRRWCHHVDFFYANEQQSNGKKAQERIERVLKLLPPGAVLPTNPDDDDSSGSDSDDGDDDRPLTAIDNSRLLFGSSTFDKQWYDTSLLLKPNLVRGYHYELLPREVYNALRSWYGEVTPSLCRRTTDAGVVNLYPPSTNGTRAPTNSNKCSACRAVGATARCKRCMSVQYCDRSCQEANWPYHKQLCKSLSKNNNNNNGTTTTVKQQYQTEGRVGLNNLGNTCFMNSALQCLSHATPLTRHFLSNQFRKDLNTSNPLGTGGKLATAYDAVMKEVWMKAKATAMSPTTLKRAIALFAPRFAGCLQHDAQEFLAYLLDGLHEDLNRIRKAPYVEMPDVTDGHNMAIAGAEAWDAHKRRNDSLVMDTFYGQFQSTCVCPKCDRVSVSFDAFNHVSLEIPQLHKLTVTIPVLVFRAATTKGDANTRTPYRYGVTLRRQCLVADLRRGLAELTGVAPNRLMICDVYENSIYELLHDKKPIANIRPNDVLAAYEVDPYTHSSIHVVATHSLYMIDQDGQEQRPLFGFPFMTSFDADATCQQCWEHLWQMMDHMATQEGRSDGFVDAEDKYRRSDVLKIRVVNSQGQPVQVFPAEDGNSTSILPIDSNDKVRDHLGNDCTENFLFLSLEWENPKEDGVDKLIDPQKFVDYADHSSLLEAIRKQRAKNGVKGVTLDQCFDTFTKPERLDEHNMWYCSKCKEHVRALKTMKLWRLPNILVVHLKRFEFKHALRRDKLDTFVDFPLQGLDMNRHCANWKAPSEGDASFVDTGVPADYDLFAVVNHYGRMGFGHYTAYARRWDEGGLSKEWALFDDSSVRPVGSGEGPEGVVTPAAYVLFYRRRSFN